MKKVNYLYYITLMSCVFLSACVKTESDSNKTIVEKGNPVVTLTNEYLQGYWEVFYNSKLYKNNATESLGTSYRYPDIEGRQIYYDKNGNYKEFNAWGKVFEEGTYKIRLKTKASEKDSISYTFPNKNGVDTTTQFAYPMVTEKYFDRYNYYGRRNTVTKQEYFIADTWYLRRVDSNYELPSLPKINNLSKSSILGTWRFIAYVYNSYNTNQTKPDLQKLIGTTYTFKEDNTYLMHEVVNNETLNGKYFIIDDVIQTMRDAKYLDKETNTIKDTVYTVFFWIKDPIKTTSTGTTFVQFDQFKDINDLTNIITTQNTYLKEK